MEEWSYFFVFVFQEFNEKFHQKGLCGNVRDAHGGGSSFTFSSARERQCEQQVSEIVLCERIT